ncbi:serine/threonine-protein kinase [Streptomyces neyagawaensis]|uniref:serine/threonine-protein kinase n=1 Tax=Streptomyces neyagawaensis TaxID=42238 RepID=UPI0030B8DDF8
MVSDVGRLVAGRYRLTEQIGRGGMGTVWRGEDEVLGRQVALKQLHVQPHLAPDDLARLYERTRREARSAARVAHPNVIVVHDVVDDEVDGDGRPCIVMEYVPAPTLADLLTDGRTVPPEEAARIGLGMIAALRAAHAAGVLHRDVKPGNVLLGADGRVVLTDFGIAMTADASTLTKTGEMVGSIHYMAPERIRGQKPGPASDLWALGALLFRAVQGHAPYPEENTAELVEMVCSEPPAFAEECGPLRPVVESLLRQDPTERLDFEELRGWLRSLVRSAPEPEAGTHVVAAPPVNASRLPIVRRRGELVRRRRAKVPATSVHARHRRAREEKPPQPRKLGRTLLLLILLALAAAVAYAMVFMPKAEPSSDGVGNGGRSDAAGQPSAGPEASSQSRPDQNSSSPDGGEKGEGRPSPSESSGSEQTQTGGPEVAQGFTLRKDAEGFQVAVATGWDRSPKNGRGQVVYSRGSFELIVVPGRDSTATYGSDPLKYQREGERELQPFRDSTWATSGGMRLVEVGGVTMAEGQFTWQDGQGRGVFVRNLAILLDGKYHVVQVRGPEAERDEVTRLYEQAADTYRVSD